MAKNKRKKYKNSNKNYKRYPPLSKKDKIIYLTLRLLLIFLFTGYFLVLCFTKNIFLKNSDVLAYEEIALWALLIIPFGLLVLGLIAFTYLTEMPIFGNKKVNYSNSSQYHAVVPLFDSRYKPKKETVKKYIITLVSIIVLFVFSFMLAVGGIISRWEISDNSIKKYNLLGQVNKSYTFDDVEAYNLDVHRRWGYIGKSLLGSETLWVELTFKDGRKKAFGLNQMQNTSVMKYIDDELKKRNTEKTIDNLIDFSFDYFIESDLSEEEVKMLREIFSQ